MSCFCLDSSSGLKQQRENKVVARSTRIRCNKLKQNSLVLYAEVALLPGPSMVNRFPTSLGQHQPNIGSMARVYWDGTSGCHGEQEVT